MGNSKILTEIKRLLELGAYNASLIAKESPSAEEDYNAIRQFIDSGALGKLKIETTQPCTIHEVSGSNSDFYIDLMKLINTYCNKGLKKADLIYKMRYALRSCEMS